MDPVQKLREKRESLRSRLARLVDSKRVIEKDIAAVKRHMQDIDTALRILHTVVDDSYPKSSTLGDDGAQDMGEELKLTVSEMISRVLGDARGSGMRQGTIRKRAQDRFGIALNSKTTSNTLWRLKEEGKVKRDGHLWYFV